MFKIGKVLWFLVFSYIGIFIALYNLKSESDLLHLSEKLAKADVQERNQNSFLQTSSDSNKETKITNKKTIKTVKDERITTANAFDILHSQNPFQVLGAYPKFEEKRPLYHLTKFGLMNEDDYCERVDLNNLLHPENMFEEKTFFTDFNHGTMMRALLPKIGKVPMNQISKLMPKEAFNKPLYQFHHKINSFYLSSDGFYRFHEIGKHFLCATQMFNHIPGHNTIVRKDEILKSIYKYSKKFENHPQCFDRTKLFPIAYRLFNEQECEAFFKVINSPVYQRKLKAEPIQYLIKVGHGMHKSQGVYLLDEEQRTALNKQYDFGQDCGIIRDPLIAQKYITNPLLLDKENKFDFRIFMLVASTNPLIVYYHDGYMRVSINSFDKFSKDRATHLTNTYLAEKKFAEARSENKTINGMDADELKEYHLWDFQDLQDYLLSAGRISDPEWLENYLRPAFQRAFIHLTKIGSYGFWNGSNVHELFGLDFMLDENLNLWFIECNPNPLLHGVKPKMITKMIYDMFDIQFAYYRSRMLRITELIRKMQDEMESGADFDITQWQAKYQEAVRNRLEPEYTIKRDNSFTLIMDENLLPSTAAYAGLIEKECIF